METIQKNANNGKAENATRKELNSAMEEIATAITEAKNQKEIMETSGRKQKVSGSYTIRALAENARKLLDLGLLTKEETENILEIQKKAAYQYMERELGV